MQNSLMQSHLDPQFEDRILHEVKSQGVFDEFRKDSIADVDTKPAYQNLRQRVENAVKKFLSEQKWNPGMNKNQLREKLRRHITQAGFLDVGVERIVDQVVNPKISTVFQPRIEEITYKYLGLPPPPSKPPPPIMHPLPPLPLSGPPPPPPPLKVDTSSLLPTGLEQVSPDSDKATVKSDLREDDKSVLDMDIDVDDKVIDDDDESPPFEPLEKSLDAKNNSVEETIKNIEANAVSTPKKEALAEVSIKKNESSPQQQEDELKESEIQDVLASTTGSKASKFSRTSFEGDALLSQDSQLSQVSSDSRISDVTANASHSFRDDSSQQDAEQSIADQTDTALDMASANISEEAQMPEFNENSSEIAGDVKSSVSELHFDIKKDEIRFEGTERKSSLLEHERESNSVIEIDNSPEQDVQLSSIPKSKEPQEYSNLNIDTDVERLQTTTGPTRLIPTPTPTPHDSSFGSSLEDVSSNQPYAEQCKNGIKNDSMNATTNSVFSTPIQTFSERKESSAGEHRGSSSSSSRHKKHSKDKRRRSHDAKDKHKNRDHSKSKTRDKSKDTDKEKYKIGENDKKDKDKHKIGDKDRSRTKSRHKDKERHKSKDGERKENYESTDKKERHQKKEHKRHKSKHNSAERSSSSKHSTSAAAERDSSSTSKYDKNGNTKHATPSSSSSSRSGEGHDFKREKRDKRENDKKKHHRSTASHGNNDGSKKINDETARSETVPDDHTIEKTKVIKRRSTDSPEGDGGGGGGGLNGGSGGNEGERETTNGSSGRQQGEQQQESVNGSSNSASSEVKCDANLMECDINENRPQNYIVEHAKAAQDLIPQSARSKVVILNDMLENPNINYIDLGTVKTTYALNSDIATSKSDKMPPPPTTAQASEKNKTAEIITPSHSPTPPKIAKDQLHYFVVENAQFTVRLRLLDNAMNRCRRVVNNLRFDCMAERCDDDGFECSIDNAEHDAEQQQNPMEEELFVENKTSKVSSQTALTVDCGVGDKAQLQRKRDSRGQFINSKPSPTLSDVSVNSKENVELDKNAVDYVKCVQRTNAFVNTKTSRQQRYSSEDLYKPRPVLSQRSRRRGMDTLV